jgi:hypothetical protein
MAIQTGNTSIAISSLTSALNSRVCWQLEDTTSQNWVGLFSSPNPVAGISSPYIALNQALSYVIDGSQALGDRETAAEQALAYCESHANSAYLRATYIFEEKGPLGGCCSWGTKCYGNGGAYDCCWTGGTWNSNIENAGLLNDILWTWRNQFKAQLDLIQIYQEDGFTDAEFQAQINLEISKVNDAIAKTKSLQEQVKLSEFLGKIVRYVIPLVALVILFYGWNVIAKKR